MKRKMETEDLSATNPAIATSAPDGGLPKGVATEQPPPAKRLLAAVVNGEGQAGGEASPPAAVAAHGGDGSNGRGDAAAVSSSNSAAATMEVDGGGGGSSGSGGAAEEGGTDMDLLLTRDTPFGAGSGALALGDFEAGDDLKELLAEAKVLVVGAGGLGCEILKNLALSGVKEIDVIDLDTIELSNLNRQFLFREKDIGRPKAVVAAEFINARVPGVTVRAHHGKIQDKGPEFYRSFSIVIAGLDNIKARIWLNSTLFSLAEKGEDGEYDLTTVVPLVDGGTEGFQGQARVIIPGKTACFHCTLDLFPPARGFQLCTIADTPRQPEHCIAFAQLMSWPEAHPDATLDADNPQHVQWVFEQAAARAERFKIEGVTYRLTLGVIKNIIPAVASTNAVIAAVSVHEAIKVLTFMGQVMNNYMMYQGPEGVYTYTTAHLRKEDCLVCGSKEVALPCAPSQTLSTLIEALKADSQLQLQAPSLSFGTSVLYMQRPPALEKSTRPNLDKTLAELGIADGEVLSITDPSVSQPMSAVVRFSSADSD